LVGLLLHSPLIEVFFLILVTIQVLDDLGVNEFMQGDTWITSDVGRVVCGLIPSLCNDLIGSITSADKDLDNYDRYDVLAGHDPGNEGTIPIL
jgi:gastric triacylglycerol lipase